MPLAVLLLAIILVDVLRVDVFDGNSKTPVWQVNKKYLLVTVK